MAKSNKFSSLCYYPEPLNYPELSKKSYEVD